MTIKTIFKFDTGKDGFEKMILVLILTAIAVLAIGIYFLWKNFPLRQG